MKKQNICKWLALCLTLVLIVTSLPLSVVAEDIFTPDPDSLENVSNVETESDSLDESILDANSAIRDNESDVYIVQEDISKRSAFEKHYLCSDGTYVAATYAEAVHYLDQSGQWQEVDCRLMTDTLNRYVVASGDCSIALPTATTPVKALSLSYNGTTFAWTLQADKPLSKTVYAEVTSVDFSEKIKKIETKREVYLAKIV